MRESYESKANREQNILDAVSLPVNRLAFERILSAGWFSGVGGQYRRLSPAKSKKNYVLAAFAGLEFSVERKFFPARP